MRLSKKQARSVVALAFALFAIMVALLLSNSRPTPPEAPPRELEPESTPITATQVPSSTLDPSATLDPSVAPTSTPDVVLNEFHRIETKNGKTVWEVRAKQGEYDATTSSAIVKDANLSLYRNSGDIVEISAEKAALSLKGGSLGSATLTGNVRIAIKDKIEAFSSEAVFDRAKNSVTVPSHVRIKNARMDIEGDNFEGDLERQVFTILRNVSTVIQPKDN